MIVEPIHYQSIMNKSNRPVQGGGEISVGPHPGWVDWSACPHALSIWRGHGDDFCSWL